jgi:hypothetical protein
MNPDRLAELEDERRFLLRSLGDLEREFDAGDVDQHDFDVLRDGYTARAANVLRSIDQGRAAMPLKRRLSRRNLALSVVGVLALAVLSGWLVARSSGQRLAGQTMTGGVAIDDVPGLLAQARQLLPTDLAGSAEAYQKVSELDPSNSEARTYTAWILVIDSAQQAPENAAAMVDAAVSGFQRVIAEDPTYADAHCLYAVAMGSFVAEPDVDLAVEQLNLCKASNPPQDMLGLANEYLGTLLGTVDSTPTESTTP